MLSQYAPPNKLNELRPELIAAKKIAIESIQSPYPFEELGRGSSGSVERCSWNKKTVAVKYLALKDKDRDHLRAEIKMMILLESKHAPNIVTLYGFTWDEGGAQNLVLAYLPNGDLQQFIKNHTANALIQGQKYHIARDVITALAFIHALEIIHGDLKSANILLDENFNAKLADFGSALENGNLPTEPTTQRWAAPEYLTEEPLTPKADIFSFSVCLWELFTWQRPFATLDSWDDNIIRQVSENNLRETVPKDCPPKIAHLINWGWAKEPALRPSANTLQQELSTPIETPVTP